METDIEYWKELAMRKTRTINALSNQIEDLETELSDANDVIDDYQSDIRRLQDIVRETETRFNDKTELLKQIGRLS